MPGGYTGYLHSLRQICEHVLSERPSPPDLANWIRRQFELSSGSAKARVAFLRKAGVLESATDQLRLNEYSSRWHLSSDDGILIGLLHSRLQFFGELLAELSEEPRSLEELRLGLTPRSLAAAARPMFLSRHRWAGTIPIR